MTTCGHSRDIDSGGASLPHISEGASLPHTQLHNIEEILCAVEAAQSELFISAIKEQQTQPPPTLFLNKNMRVFFFSLFFLLIFSPSMLCQRFYLESTWKINFTSCEMKKISLGLYSENLNVNLNLMRERLPTSR